VLLRSLALAGLGLTLAIGAAPAVAAPVLPLGHSGRWITDAQGRVVVVHGVNEVMKFPPYYPSATGFGDDDAAFLQSSGLDAVRVGVIWKALEPQPGVYDDLYLARIADTVRTLAAHGIVSLLDFHQDLLNEKFGGEGWPDWAILDGGLPAQPLLGFPLSYATSPGLNFAMSNFYANAAGPGGVGIQDRLAAAWRHVARQFASNPYVLGYDLLNEPWSINTNAIGCYTPGCPAVEQQLLAPAEAKMMRAIRTVDQTHLLWYEPIVETQAGLGSYNLPNPTGDPKAGMSFHVYCLGLPGRSCSDDEQSSLDQAVARGTANGDALIETEWGATDDVGLIDRQLARDDRAMMSWMWWAYTGNDPTTSGGGGAQAIINDPAKPPIGANVKLAKLRHLVEPYPQVVAGTPQPWSFSSGVFNLSYTSSRAGGGWFGAGSVTDVFIPSLWYAGGYAATVAGGAIVSTPGASVLQIAACPGASTVTATVRTAGVSAGSCRPRLQLTIAPRRFRAGHPTTFHLRVVAALGSYRQPVRGAVITFAGRRVRTGDRGRASLRITLRGRVHHAEARAPGLGSARTTVLA
jgi:endoglycosylceramidase